MQRSNSISVFVFLTFLLVSFTAFNLQAQLTDFRGEMPIWITNNTNSTLTNYACPLRVNTQMLITLGLLDNTGKDMRFGNDCSGTTLFLYYLSGYLNTDSTLIRVKVPSIPANDSVMIYMFFGNPTATSQSTLDVYNGPHSSTDSVVVASTNTVSNCQRGFRFTPTQNLLVTHFGKRIPNATQRYVTLFNFTTQQIVKQAQVDAGTVGQYNYNMLDTPFTLLSGQQYILTLFNGTGDMYYYGTSSQIGQHLTYGDMRYCNTCTQNTFPTSVLTNYHYGTPDFLYYVVTTVTPEPTNNNLPLADTNTPAAPTGVDAAQGDMSAIISWNGNTEFDLDFYLLFRGTINDPNSATQIDSLAVSDTTYADSNLTNGTTYYYWVKAGDRFCSPRVSNFSAPDSVIPNPIGIIKNGKFIPKVFALYQNFPNPFNPVTHISFDIPKVSFVRITIYDMLGREVETLVNQIMGAGRYKADWDAVNFASGIYFYKIEAGSFVDMKKMVVLK